MLVSTRGGAIASPSRAILQGIAPDGGLYAPQELPDFSIDEINALFPLPYAQRAQRILSALLDDFSDDELLAAAQAAYDGTFDGGCPAPVRTLNGNTHMLELFHGPTLAFKDMALQLLPHLLALSAKKNNITDEICVLAATSGDTGKAALEGFCDVPGTRCVVFYPKDGVSHSQYLQMATQTGRNTHVIAVSGNFDHAQAGVKQIFTDPAIAADMKRQGVMLSSANSINYGRLVPQVAYYFSAYADLVGRGAIRLGDKIHFVVPTGNFGNLLAAIYAKKMGLPIDRLICASNANRVLSDFICSGVYDSNRPFYKTNTPSMDILISSNLERYLYELTGGDIGQVRDWMEGLSREGYYTVDKALRQRMRGEITGGWVANDEVMQTILRTFHQTHTLIDPHTAVATAMLDRYRLNSHDMTPAVIVATASPFKFGHAVAKALDCCEKEDYACCQAISRVTGQAIPDAINKLYKLPILFEELCTPSDMKKCFLEHVLHHASVRI